MEYQCFEVKFAKLPLSDWEESGFQAQTPKTDQTQTPKTEIGKIDAMYFDWPKIGKHGFIVGVNTCAWEILQTTCGTSVVPIGERLPLKRRRMIGLLFFRTFHQISYYFPCFLRISQNFIWKINITETMINFGLWRTRDIFPTTKWNILYSRFGGKIFRRRSSLNKFEQNERDCNYERLTCDLLDSSRRVAKRERIPAAMPYELLWNPEFKCNWQQALQSLIMMLWNWCKIRYRRRWRLV